MSRDRAYRYGEYFTAEAHCNTTNTVECLRALPVIDTFMSDVDGINGRWPPFPDSRRPPLAPFFPWGPMIDGVDFPAMPLDLLRYVGGSCGVWGSEGSTYIGRPPKVCGRWLWGCENCVYF